jgi:hypothetical protein
MAVPKSIRITEDEDFYKIVFDDDLKDAALVDTEPDSRIVTMAIGLKPNQSMTESGEREVDVAIAEVSFPKQLYNRDDIARTAGILDKAIKEQGCPPCVILSTTEETKKTYKLLGTMIIPTWKDLLPTE